MAITNSQITGALNQITITDGNGNITDIILSNSVTANLGNFTNVNVINTLVAPTGNISALNVGSLANLGAVGNVKIGGGSNGGILTTDGTGNLSWTNRNALAANIIIDGTSNVQVYPNGNVAFGINTDPNVLVVHSGGITTDGANVLGNLTVGGVSHLGPNGNVKIDGGQFGWVLATDGTGDLFWVDPCCSCANGGGGGGSGVTQIIAGNNISISPGTGVGVVTISADPAIRPQFQWTATTSGFGQTFTNANLAEFIDGTYASVYINGVLQEPQNYTIVGTTLRFNIKVNSGDVIQVGPTGAGGGSGSGGGSVTSVGTTQFDPSGLGFTLTGGTITSTGIVTLNVPSATALRGTLGIGNIANYPALNGNGNTYLNGNGQWVTISGTGNGAAGTNWNSVANIAVGDIVVGAWGQATPGSIIAAGDGWTQQTSNTTQQLNAITYANGQFVAGGTSPPLFLTSPDGTNWIVRAGVPSFGINDITYGAGLYVAVGSTSEIQTSPDGITWTARTSPVTNNLNGITYGGGQFVAVGENGTILTSPDGITWTNRTTGFVRLQSVVYGVGQYVAVGDAPTPGTGKILTSPDGITWTNVGAPSILDFDDITYGAGLYVAISPTTGVGIYSSPDGITWTQRSTTSTNAVTYGGGKFVAVGAPSGFELSSIDGINWTSVPTNTGTNTALDVTYGGGKYVAVGQNGIVITSGTAAQPLYVYSNATSFQSAPVGSYRCLGMVSATPSINYLWTRVS